MKDLLKKEIRFGKPMIGEEERNAIMSVLDSPMLVHGPKLKEFEDKFCKFTNAGHAVSLSSCTAGLHLAYFNLGLGVGDEVIVPAQTHTATAHAVEFTGAKPVFVDAELQTGNIDIDQIESAITEETKAISLVHYLGLPVDMERLNAIAKKHNLFVVEDCALAIGSYYKGVHAGLLGDVGCFSFYPIKHMTTAEGGMLISKHKTVADNIRSQRAFGIDRVVTERKIPGQYDVNMLGFNYRMNELQAAMGIVQLGRMEEFLRVRKENYETLAEGLRSVSEIQLFQSTQGDYQSSYYCLSVILNDQLATKRIEIIKSLKEKGVGTSIYYPEAVPQLSYYKNKYGIKDGEFPNAVKISHQSIALPVGPHLNKEDMNIIIEEFKNSLQEVG